MGVCASAPKAVEQHDLGSKIKLKGKMAIIMAEPADPLADHQLSPGAELDGSNNLGRSEQSFLIRSEGDTRCINLYSVSHKRPASVQRLMLVSSDDLTVLQKTPRLLQPLAAVTMQRRQG